MGRWSSRVVAWLLLPALGLVSPGLAVPQPKPPRNSQVQVSRQFLRALLRSDFAGAYGQLAPEVRRAVSAARFKGLARPASVRGRQRGANIELYKMGVRLDESRQGSRLFVAWAWAADSATAHRLPPEWLEVTFRDTAARQVLGFALRRR